METINWGQHISDHLAPSWGQCDKIQFYQIMLFSPKILGSITKPDIISGLIHYNLQNLDKEVSSGPAHLETFCFLNWDVRTISDCSLSSLRTEFRGTRWDVSHWCRTTIKRYQVDGMYHTGAEQLSSVINWSKCFPGHTVGWGVGWQSQYGQRITPKLVSMIDTFSNACHLLSIGVVFLVMVRPAIRLRSLCSEIE